MVLSPNDGEVANSSKKHTQAKLFQTKMVEIDTLFQTKTAKKTPFSTTHTYIAYIRDYLPPGAKNASQIMILAAYASETNKANPENNARGRFCNSSIENRTIQHRNI